MNELDGVGSTMSLVSWLARLKRPRSDETFGNILRGESDQQLRGNLQQATQAEAMLDEMVRLLSHRYEPDQLACARARLKRVREYIHLARLECAERKVGRTSIARQS